MKKTFTKLAVLAATASFASPGFAHHGPGQFNGGDVVVTGNITKVAFVNPHGYIYFDAKDENGEMEAWRCELQAGSLLRRAGWTEDIFPIGGEVTVSGSAGTKERTACALRSVVLTDGRTLGRQDQLTDAIDNAVKTPSKLVDGKLDLNGTWAAPQRYFQSADAGAAGGGRGGMGDRGAGGMGARGRGGRGALPNGLALTDAGTAAVAQYQAKYEVANPRHRCEASNIFFDWTFDRHVNGITQTDSTITMKYGLMDIVRTIHLDQTEHPKNITPSQAGHSIGRLDGPVLTVDTVGFMDGGYLSGGLITSDQLHVKETFTYKAEDNSLTRTYTAVDPKNFTGTYSGEDVVYVSNTPFEAYSCVELMDDYIEPVDGNGGPNGDVNLVPTSTPAAPGASLPTEITTTSSPIKYLGGLGLLLLAGLGAFFVSRRSKSQ